MPQPTRFVVSAGTVPEGFCPASWQEALDTFISLIAVTPSQQYSTFVTGSQAPTSNEGPWLKDGAEWFIWSDSLGMYVPMTKEGFTATQQFETDSVFVVPDFIFKLSIQAWGAGGGGGDEQGAAGGGGAGGGGYGQKTLDVNPGDNVTITIGTGGVHGAPGTDGTDTIVTSGSYTLTCGGGKGGLGGGAGALGGEGGTVTNADIAIKGGSGDVGRGAVGEQGGDSPTGGAGGSATFKDGVTPGGGGAGGESGAAAGGLGANGRVVIMY